MIVDLKTGSKAFTAEEARENPQLGLYQLAFDQGAFENLLEWPEGFDASSAKLAGAKLLLVSGDKPTEREQGSISEESLAKEKFENMIATATHGMAMEDQVFVAQVGSHCTNENEFGSCKIHLTRAVSYAG